MSRKKLDAERQKKLNELPSHVASPLLVDSNLGAFSFAKTADENFARLPSPRAS
jgi:hypothetical protein